MDLADDAPPDIRGIARDLRALRNAVPPDRSVLVAVSGIDGSGKGYVGGRLASSLAGNGLGVALINIDGWLNLPHRRFDPSNPAEHFYLHAIRFEEMFARFIVPLRDQRRARVEVDHVDETASTYRRVLYEYDDVDVILLEGIFLLKRAFRALYDAAYWIDCTFETALERAVARAQEGLSAEDTVRAYRTIYFPAQEIHFRRDSPRDVATAIVPNDPRLAGSGQRRARSPLRIRPRDCGHHATGSAPPQPMRSSSRSSSA